MKKLILVLLTAVLILSLAACSESPVDTTKSIVGKWSNADASSVLEIHEDNTGVITNYGEVLEFTWMYDTGSRLLLFTLVDEDWIEDGTYLADTDSIYCDGWIYTRVTE